MIACHYAAPAQGPHIPKSVTPPYRNRLRRPNRQFDTPVGERVPDAVKHLLKNQQFHIVKMAIEIDDHLPGTFWSDDIVHRNS
ncbi:Uncharacterised protein [Salmonella enterica subsp. enterica serovar Bovismorbificans]|uniref:Uncharacterized protein n=1 Tax=Salmonella enterica subsp. enterica serovar Bovismorbificans TaxID=58097 RepID=A0A655C0K8_SALET|nr:Uncharacterised protein [Salmonella enterica subsp. enterica serovar Bovismorbificans]